MRACKKENCVYARDRYRVLIVKQREMEALLKVNRWHLDDYLRRTKINRQLRSAVKTLKVRIAVLNSVIERQEKLLIARDAK